MKCKKCAVKDVVNNETKAKMESANKGSKPAKVITKKK